MLARFYKDRRRAQAGTTLVELLVSLMIMGLSLVLIVGTISTGLLDAALAKRNTAAEAVVQYEMGKIAATQFSVTPSAYSECFATESADNPEPPPCPGDFTLRADVSVEPGTTSTSPQKWTVTVFSLLNGAQVGSPISIYKVNR
jgi:type II secretory pathway pseudopilin PulG